MKEFDIPESWAIAKLDIVADRKGGGTPSRKQMSYYKGNIPWITVADIPREQSSVFKIISAREFITKKAIEDSATNLIPSGSVVLSTRVSVGKVGINSVDICTNQDFSSFTNCRVETNYLANFLLSKQEFLLRESKGTTIKGINLAVLSKLDLPLPPIKEQKRIVKKIKVTFDKIDQIESIVQTIGGVTKNNELDMSKLMKLRRSILQRAFSGRLVNQDISEGTGHELLKKILLQNEKKS